MKALAVIGGAIGGGGGGGGGTAAAPVDAPNTLRSKSYVEIVEAWCWGEIEGFPSGVDPLERVYLDGVPVKSGSHYNYAGVQFDWRPGTQDQTYIPGTTDAVGSPVAVNTAVLHGTPLIRSITDPAIDAVDIILDFPNGLVNIDQTNGNRNPISVAVAIAVSTDSGGSWATIGFGGRETISGKTESAYQRTYYVDLRAVSSTASSYEIRVSRISADPTGYQQSAVVWDSYIQLAHVKLRRPNIAHCRLLFDSQYFSKIPTRGYLLRGWRIQVPPITVYDPIARTYTGTFWDGSFVKSWSRNPAWFLYAVLTTPGAGLGADINPAYQDKWTIFTIAKRCDELVPNGHGGFEPRYSLDYFFQAKMSAIDLIQTIAGVFDAQALWSGTAVYVTQDAPKPVSALFLPANVVGGRFSYAGTSRQVRYTAAIIQYSDPSMLYQLQPEYVEDLAGIQRYQWRPKTEAAIGVTSRGQAHRHGKRLLITGRTEIDTVTFSVGLNGISAKPGDVIRIADPLRYNGVRMGGRLSSGSTAAAIVLDAAVTLASGASYRVAIIGTDGLVWDAAITNSPGVYSTLNVSPAFSAAPDAELEFIVYAPAADAQLWRLLRITDTADRDSGFYTIVATQYDAAKFGLIDDVAQLPPLPDNPYIQSGVIPPSALHAQEGTYTALEGIRRFLDISWTVSTDPLLRGYFLVVAINGAVTLSQEIAGHSYRLDNPAVGDYSITLKAVNLLGLYSASINISHTVGQLYVISAVNITGLSLPSGTSEFTGTDAIFSWSTNADSVLGSAFANGQGGQSPWFRDFEIKIYDTSTTPVLLRTEYVTQNYYTYSFQKNVADGGPRRSFTIHVKARDYYGNYSNESILNATNPPPTTFGAVTITPGLGQIFVSYVQPADVDYAYTNVYASQTAGFVPGSGNLKNSSSSRVVGFSADAGTWYLRLQGVDAFGPIGTTYSSELSVTVTVSDITVAVDALLATPGRASDFVIEAARFLVTLNDGSGTPQTVFGIGSVGGVTKVGIKGDLLLDGSFNAQSVATRSLAADSINTTMLSAIAADIGTCTAGTFSTNPDMSSTGPYRVEISDSGNYPLWIGHGSKTPGNALFYVDKIGGQAYFSGALSAASGTFVGAMTAGSININSRFTVASDGTTTIYDGSGNVILASGSGINALKLFNLASAPIVSSSNPLTPANINTYMPGAAIGTAQIGTLAVNLANINDLSVNQFKIVGGSLTYLVDYMGSWGAGTGFSYGTHEVIPNHPTSVMCIMQGSMNGSDGSVCIDVCDASFTTTYFSSPAQSFGGGGSGIGVPFTLVVGVEMNTSSYHGIGFRFTNLSGGGSRTVNNVYIQEFLK